MTAGGRYRRRIVVQVRNGHVDAGMEDDFHHFRVRLEHDGESVTGVRGEAVRFPWDTCSGASTMLDRLLGASLRHDALRHTDAYDRFHQCTHQLELALLAIAAASRRQSRCYDVTVTDPDEANLQRVTLCEDDVVVEEWTLRSGVVLFPDELAGQDVRALRPWVETLDDERYERIAILRRCLQVGAGRLKTVLPDVASNVTGARNACYAFQDERAAFGYFISESMRDHSDGRRLLDGSLGETFL